MVAITISDIMLALLGGALMGLAAATMYLAIGRIMGVSGILSGVLVFPRLGRETIWRGAFLVGMLLASWLLTQLWPTPYFDWVPPRGLGAAGLGGFLVGLGSTLGNGCTTGHGICGISRISVRSISATMLFIVGGALVVFFLGATS